MTLKLRLNERKLGVHSSSSSSKPAVGRRKEAETPTSLLQCSIYPATQPTSLKLDSNGIKQASSHILKFICDTAGDIFKHLNFFQCLQILSKTKR